VNDVLKMSTPQGRKGKYTSAQKKRAEWIVKNDNPDLASKVSYKRPTSTTSSTDDEYKPKPIFIKNKAVWGTEQEKGGYLYQIGADGHGTKTKI
jgi:hypothetical protein